MSVNGYQVAGRTHPYDPSITANGSYTLPQYAFIPHPALQQLSRGIVQGPMPMGVQSAAFAAPPGLALRALPGPQVPVYGIRVLNYKTSP